MKFNDFLSEIKKHLQKDDNDEQLDRLQEKFFSIIQIEDYNELNSALESLNQENLK